MEQFSLVNLKIYTKIAVCFEMKIFILKKQLQLFFV